MNYMHIFIIIIILLILLFLTTNFSETFISYTANLSEYGPQPYIILTKYIPNKLVYSELDATIKKLKVLEIFKDKTYKVYSDDGLVREGIINNNMWQVVLNLDYVAKNYNNKQYCDFKKHNVTHYSLWVNGYSIDLGLFAECCTPVELYSAKKLFELMHFSDISR